MEARKQGKLELTALLLALAFTFVSVAGRGADALPSTNTPHYTLKLNLNEFSILNVSEMDGLLKYGGGAEFKLQMTNEGSNVVWTVTIDSPRLLELVNVFVGERTIKLVQNLDANNLDTNQKIALEAIKSLSRKLESAGQHPAWQSVRLTGTVTREGTNWILQTTTGPLRVTGEKLSELERSDGKPVIAEGFTKVAGEYEVTRFVEKPENTLQLFVMGLCPFSQKAELRLLEFLGSTNTGAKPRLDIHYIFYQQTNDGAVVNWSLHGEAEMTEDLVQMSLRDYFPQTFKPYLLLRAKEGGADWKRLVGQVGLRQEEINTIEKRITSDRQDTARAEYDYAAGLYGITDGSPTYVWEGERVTDLSTIPAFKGIDSTKSDTCAH